MASQMAVYVCDTAAKAQEAAAFLAKSGFPAAAISTSQVDVFNYDAATYDGGNADSLTNKFVVVGKA